jgi:hypothetical protein
LEKSEPLYSYTINNLTGVSKQVATRKVTITLTNKVVGSYEARSYPHDDMNGDGKIELYKVPLFEISIAGVDDTGNAVTFTHKAPRFMPYWNNPRTPDPHYHTKGWVNAGLSQARTIKVERYIRHYEVRNRYSPGRGAIVMKGAFYIHAGPASEADVGFGSAGCVEIIGNYDIFKANIASLSGYPSAIADDAIAKLVMDRKLTVIIKNATVPDIKKLYTRQIR